MIARREFVERVRTGWFAITTLLGPLGILAVIVLPACLSEAGESAEIRILDRSGVGLGEGMGWAVEIVDADVRARPAAAEVSEEALARAVGAGEIAGYFVVPEDVLAGGEITYRGRNAADVQFLFTLREVANMAVRTARLAEAGFSRAEAAEVFAPAPFDARHAGGARDPVAGEASFVIGYAVMIVLYMSIIIYAVNVLRGVVQEKTSRAVEMILSAARPRSLMLGKVAGVGAVGLFQLAIWAGLSLAMLRHQDAVVSVFGVSDPAFELPGLPPDALAVALAFFLLGFFFYASLYAAVGAMVSSDQEAQQAQTPLLFLLVLPVVCVSFVTRDPSGAIAQALTLIPLSSPVLMPMRFVLGGAGLGEVLLSMALLAVAIAAAVWAASRIYRIGILSHGARPSLRDLGRWIWSAD